MKFLGALGLILTSISAASAQSPTIEELEADPDYTRVESVTLAGECEPNPILGDMMRARDNAKKLHEAKCDHIIYTKPGDTAATREKGLVALARANRGGTAYFRGTWDEDGYLEMEFEEVSFDQEIWHPVIKGRMRTYGNDNGALMMIFAVFEVERRNGRKRNEGIAVAFYPSGTD